MAYEMRDNKVQEDPDAEARVDESPAVEPEKIFNEAMSHLESITQEWTEVVQSVKR